jgi:hypothetical protein
MSRISIFGLSILEVESVAVWCWDCNAWLPLAGDEQVTVGPTSAATAEDWSEMSSQWFASIRNCELLNNTQMTVYLNLMQCWCSLSELELCQGRYRGARCLGGWEWKVCKLVLINVFLIKVFQHSMDNVECVLIIDVGMANFFFSNNVQWGQNLLASKQRMMNMEAIRWHTLLAARLMVCRIQCTQASEALNSASNSEPYITTIDLLRTRCLLQDSP